jgi:hypothetical protein
MLHGLGKTLYRKVIIYVPWFLSMPIQVVQLVKTLEILRKPGGKQKTTYIGVCKRLILKWAHQDLNPGPIDYERICMYFSSL